MFGESLINKLYVYFISDHGQEIIKTNKRSYGDGLDKFEPRDLNDCLCPSQKQFNLFDDEEAREVINIAKTNEKLAIEMSNNLIQRITNAQKSTVPYDSAPCN
jgi:adenine-specific DNA-methyltransferase